MSASAPFTPVKIAALTLNGLGDSIIGGQSCYALLNSATYQAQLANNVPAWAPSTAYALNNVVKNGGQAYYCTTAGTSAASGGPSGQASSISDGSCVWHFDWSCRMQKNGTSMLFWAEAFSLGYLRWDLQQGYGGLAQSLLKVIVINGGSGYSAGDTVTFPTYGAKGTLTIVGGVITACTVTNPGFSSTNTFGYSLTTSTGSGAVLSLVVAATGTFGVPGCATQDMVAKLPDCLASSVDIFLVNGGTNDVVGLGLSAPTICANLRTCYETLMAAGRKVIASPITPRSTNNTSFVMTQIQRVNRWIRAYCRAEPWANPNGFNQIALADPTGYWTDGTTGLFNPIGGTGGVANAMTQDGLHPSHRGAIYWGWALWQAAQKFVFASPAYASRGYSADDGYDLVNNPGGNMFEGPSWQTLTAYVVGQQVFNGTSIYRCTGAGTSGSTGPLGSSSPITDGTVTWYYIKPAKLSVMGAASTSVAATVGSVTVSGNLPFGMGISRYSGTAAGTIVCAIESPWSNGQKGQRVSLTCSLGSGGTTEQWAVYLGFSDTVTSMNILASELGNGASPSYFEFEAEVEISNIANLTQLYLFSASGDTNVLTYTGANAGGAGYEFPASSGDPFTWPNGGKLLLRSAPILLPSTATDFFTQLIFGWNASGGAGSATTTIKLNYLSARRYGKQ
jgi:lysophospholipase L1-like esterase